MQYWDQRPVLLTWINFNPTGLRNYIHYTMWYKITNPFPNFNGLTVEVWEWISNCTLLLTGHVITYPCWKLSHVSKRDPRGHFTDDFSIVVKFRRFSHFALIYILLNRTLRHFCSWPDSKSCAAYAKSCSHSQEHSFIKSNSQQIWITIEKSLVKRCLYSGNVLRHMGESYWNKNS